MTTSTDLPNCETSGHDWAYEHKLTPTFPPIQRKICAKCLTLTQERGINADLSGRFGVLLAQKQGGSNA